MALIRRPLGAPRQCRSSVVSVTMVLPRKAVRSNARIPARNTSDRSGPLNRGRRARWRDRSGSHDAFPEFAFRQAISAQVSISTMFVGLSAGRVDVSETLAKTRDRREVLFTGRYSDVQGESDSGSPEVLFFAGSFWFNDLRVPFESSIWLEKQRFASLLLLVPLKPIVLAFAGLGTARFRRSRAHSLDHCMTSPDSGQPNDPVRDQMIDKYYREHARELWALFYAMCSDADRAYDAVQEAFLRYYDYGGEPVRDLRAWLLRVGQNWLRDVARKKSSSCRLLPGLDDMTGTTKRLGRRSSASVRTSAANS